MNPRSLPATVLLLQFATCVSVDDVFVRRVGKPDRRTNEVGVIGPNGKTTVQTDTSDVRRHPNRHVRGTSVQTDTSGMADGVRRQVTAKQSGQQKSVPESDLIYAQKAHDLADEFESGQFLANDGTGSISETVVEKKSKQNQQLQHYGQEKSPLVSDLICEGMPPSHVAILLIGQCRSFKLPVFHHSLKVNVVDALGSNARVFVAVTAREEDRNVCQKAIDVLNPTTQEPMEIETPSNRNPHCRMNMSEHLLSSFLNQYWKVNLAFKSMEKYEASEGMRFNWVLRVRPDLIYPRSLPPLCFFDDGKQKLYHDRADFMMLVPRQAAPVILNAWVEYQKCNETLPGNVSDPEHWLVHYAHKAGFDMMCNGWDACTNNFVVHNMFAGILARDYICCQYTLKGSDAMRWCDTFKDHKKTRKEDKIWQQKIFDSSLIEQEAAARRSEIAANPEESEME